jgi:hypothetical protein
MTTHTPPPTDQFRVGDIWRSPRGKDWRVELVAEPKVRLRALHNRHTTQWRYMRKPGVDTPSGWQRIDPPRCS